MIVDSSESSGTCVIVKSTELEDGRFFNVAITCEHVVNPLNDKYVLLAEYVDWSHAAAGEISNAFVYSVNYDMDIAVICFITQKKQHEAVIGLDKKFYIGNEVMGIGCALRQFPRLDYGVVTGYFGNDVRTSIHTIHGDSGGPVFHENELVGIKRMIPINRNQGMTSPLYNISMFVPITALADWNKQENEAFNFIFSDGEMPKLALMMFDAANTRP